MREFKPDPLLKSGEDIEFVPVEGQTYVRKKAGAAQGKYLSTALRDRMKTDGRRFWAGDNIRFKMKRDNKRFWAGDNISGINTMLHKGSNFSKLTSV